MKTPVRILIVVSALRLAAPLNPPAEDLEKGDKGRIFVNGKETLNSDTS